MQHSGTVNNMGVIIVPGAPNADPYPFLSLVDRPEDKRRTLNGFTNILAGSFREDERRQGKEFVRRIHTLAEEKRRAEIIGRWFRVMRAELGYSLSRTLDEIPRALRTELDGGKYTPPERDQLWAPGGA